ncbi:MAG: rpsE [Gammaproteobacteria bacterium]|jgi:small subunit ribosomal protein S5|nr:rpsE [Gammaproteobacteria bacterium]
MASFDQSTKSDGLIEKLVVVKRNAKTVKGGRVFSFRALVVVGDGNGRIGVGSGKAKEVPVAIQKAMYAARRNMVKVELNNKTILHRVEARYGATKVVMLPASEGTGIIAGGAVRAVFEVLGVSNVLAKIIGSSNPDNVIRAVINGLTSMSNPAQIAHKRGKVFEEAAA